MRKTTSLGSILIATASITLAGCVSRPSSSQGGPVYPSQISSTRVMDIQARVHSQTIEFTNTSSTRFESPRIWLNRWYSATVDTIEPGQAVVVPIASFIDENARSPRVGGFFASREQEDIVSIEIEHASRMDRLVVVRTER